MAAPCHSNIKNIVTTTNSDIESCQKCQNSYRKKRICICLLCGLPGSGKTTLLRLLFPKNINSSLLPPPTKTKSTKSSTFTSSTTSSSTTALMLEKFAIVGIEYDSILSVHPFPPILEKCEQFQEQELNRKWKSDRIQIVSAIEAIIQHIFCNSGDEFPPVLQSPENQVWQKCLQILDSLKMDMKNNKNEVVLVVDDNMYFRSMRYEYYKLARKYQTGYCQIHVKCSIDKAVERNKCREEFHQVPEEIILRMSGKFEPPDPEKYNWETNSITISSEVNNINIDQVYTIIQKAIMNPVQPLEEIDEEEKLKSRIECSANVLHQADLVLRKCVATKMASLKSQIRPDKLKEISKHMCQVKEKIITDLKDGKIPLDLSKGLNISNSAQEPNSEFFKYIESIFLMEISRS